MGLLGNGWGDPQSSANMALAAGLLRGDVGAGLLGSDVAYQRTRQNQSMEQMHQLQMQNMQAQMEDQRRQREQQAKLDEAARGSFVSPGKANAMSMGPMPNGSAMPQVQPGFDPQQYLQALYQVDPQKAVAFQQSIAKDNSPLTVAPGASLVDRHTMKPLFTAPKEQAAPAAIQEYQFAQQQGYRGSFEQWDRERKKAGASNVSLSVNSEKTLLNDIAGGLGKGIVDAKGNAQAALSTIGTVNRMMDALDSGQVMAGPGTTFRQFGLQVGNMVGVAGQNAQEKMVNTRQTIQSLAQLELDAAQQMKGQGQITEAERGIIRRAASGDIDSMTVPELRLLGGILDRTARTKIRSYNSQVKPLASNPNAATLAPFLNVEEPGQRAPAAGTIRRYNPATGRIE